MKKSTILITVLVSIGLILFFSGISRTLENTSSNVAKIKVSGQIVGDGSAGLLGDSVASSTQIVKLIQKAADNKNVVAILIEMNTPGGSAVASDEISKALEKSNKTTITVIREVGASGGYWIASSTDHIIAHPLSITGSIGVIGSYLDFSGFIQDNNVTYQQYTSGKYKDLGTPFRKPTRDEQNFLQGKLDTMHDYFITHVSENRGMSKTQLKDLSEGQIFLGVEALEVGLIDELGGIDEAIKFIENKHNVTVTINDYKQETTLTDLFSGVFSKLGFNVGKGIGEEITSKGSLSITT